MTVQTKVLVAVAAVVVSVLAALVVVPFLFRDRLAERVRAEIDDAVAARVDWSGVRLSLLRDFPNLTVGLDDLTVAGVDRFEGDSLAAMERFQLVLDLGSVVRSLRRRGPVVVRSVRLEEPRLRLRVLEDGTANWDILRKGPDDRAVADASGRVEADDPTDTAAREEAGAAGRDLRVELHDLAIDDGTVVLDDERAGLSASFRGVRHSLRGDFSRDRLVVRTRTHSAEATVRFAGVPYLEGVALDLDANVEADLAGKTFSFLENELRVNDLTLTFSGEAARVGEELALDVTMAAPGADFRQILSLVPAIYQRDFETLEAEGVVSLDGHVRGILSEASFPAFAVHATVDRGAFRYSDLPLPARNVSVDLAIENPGRDVDSTVVSVDRFHIELGQDPIDGALTIRTPVSDPDIDLRVEGTLDLADLARTVKLEGVEELRGVVTADATLGARMSDLDAGRYERVTARGGLSARGVRVRSVDLPHPMEVEDVTLALSPRRAELTSFHARIGASDIQATGSVDNLPGFALRDEPLRGTATVASSHLELDEWRSAEPDRDVVPVPGMIDLAIDATVGEVAWRDLAMADARGRVRVRDRRVTLEDFRGAALGGRIGVSGFYDTTDPDRPTFGVDVGIDGVDIPGASAAFVTVRKLAPVARYAAGTFSADLTVDGAMGTDMTPLFDVLSGRGTLRTSTVVVQGFPLMERLAGALEIPRLANPTIEGISSSIEIRDGRLHLRPFEVRLGTFTMLVQGSNGVDQSLDYTLALAVPRRALGEAADRVVGDLMARAGRTGVDLRSADAIELGIRVTGTVADPSIEPDFKRILGSTQELVEGAAAAEVERGLEAARERARAVNEEARRRAQARADSIVADATERATVVREQARRLADEIRQEADRRAEEVLARATNPVARAAARQVADRIREEADGRADGIVQEADRRADAIEAEARTRADAILKAVGGGGGRGPPPVSG